MQTRNAAIYIQQGSGDLSAVFEKVSSDKSLSRKPSWYEVRFGDDTVRFNILDKASLGPHIAGFLRYIDSLQQDERRKADAAQIIGRTTVVLGLQCPREFDENSLIWESLFRIADRFDGVVFVHDSVLLPSGAVLVGPLLDATEP